MNPVTLFRLFFRPTAGWEALMASQPTVYRLFLLHVLPFSLLPSVMIYLAGRQHGLLFFELLPGIKLAIVAFILYLVQLVVVAVMAAILRQLAEVIDVHPSYRQSFILAAVAPTPLWLAPLFLIFPSVQLNILISVVAMMAAAGFIYYGIPVVFKVEERGHVNMLFGAILVAGATAWGFLMACTLVVWGSVQSLQFAL